MKSERNLKDVIARRMDCFTRRPETAAYKPKVTSRHVRNLYTESMAREHVVKSDYGEAAGGDNQAPNPIELLLAAVAACIEASFYEFAVHEGFTVTKLSVDVEGTLDLRGLFMLDNVAAGFKDLRYTMNIESPDDEARIREFAHKVIDHCPVVESLKQPTPVSGRIVVSKGEKRIP